MTRTDRQAFAEVLAQVAEVFDAEVSTAKAEAYFEALAHLSIDDVRSACSVAVRTCHFFPRPADLIDLVEGELEERAAFAWTEVMRAIRGRRHALDDTGLAAIELLGGWREVDWLTYRHVTPVDVATARKSFLQLYRVAAKRREGRYALERAPAHALEPARSSGEAAATA